MPLLNEKTVNDILISQNNSMESKKDSTTIPMQKNMDENVGKVKKKSIPERIPAFGLLMALISVVCFSVGSVIVKVLTEMHSIQVLVIRCLFQFIFYLSATLIGKYPFFGQSGHRLDLTLRCISGTISLTTIFMAYRLMPLADASTIHFSSPVFVTILAYFMLKEPLTILQGITGTITLIGVIIIAKPEFIFGSEMADIHDNRLLGTILAVIAAITAAFSMINLRKLKTTPVAVIVMWYSAMVIVSGLIILVIINKLVLPVGLRPWSLLVAIGFCGIGDQYFMTLSFQYESAGPISVTRTFNIVLSFIWEVLLLQESIEWTSVIGACLVSSCVIILALVKWKTEKPELFERCYERFCCCFRRKKENNLKSIPDSLRASTDSIDSIQVQSTVHSNAILLKSDDQKSKTYT